MKTIQDKTTKLKELCDLFESNSKQYKSSKYDESNTRTDFIDKFFKLLDWDVSNDQGYSEDYRDVVREDKVIIEGKPKAPDYSFRIGGVRKFFLEAKKPSVNIKDDIEPAYQIRRYGYTAQLPLCILTNFEELSIYDTRIKPNKNDKASVARIFYCTYKDYGKNFDFIYKTFSKEAILKGSFAKYIEENKNKKGTGEVDKEFLSLIESWRETLAKNIALRNSTINSGAILGVHELNTVVQTIIDRIIFLRIAEDRNIEKYGTLLNVCNEGMSNQSNIPTYSYIDSIFKDADKKYNSGLFKIEKWISNLIIDDKILQNIIRNLYYPDCPYELSVLPIEILGNIYEQFLGKTIRLTPSHQAKVEEKEEIRKAGGVYYTPQYIVDYIVENTVGEMIRLRTASDKKFDLYNHPKLTILDPACGSGSFLVGAYTYLLNKYLESYTNKKRLDKCLRNGLIYPIAKDTYKLSIEVKQHILLNHIFGVDIDYQAVEVTKLSLLLKLMENENAESADRLFKHSDIKLLPDLSNNIKCGNSLIGSDFYEDKDLSLFGKEEMRKVNVFDWENEFPNIFVGDGLDDSNSGFDIVIGNPPWVSAWTEKTNIRDFITSKYPYLKGHWDTYLAFLVKSIQLLNKNSLQSFILPSSILTEKYASEFRKFLIESKKLKLIGLFGTERVFNLVSRKVAILIIDNQKNTDIVTILENKIYKDIQLSNFLNSDNYIFNQDINTASIKLKTKIEKKSLKIGNIFYVNYGAQISSKIKGKFTQDFLLSTVKKGNSKRCLKGNSIKRYKIIYNGLYLDYQKEIMYGPRTEKFFEARKIIVNKISDNNFKLQASFDDEQYYCDQRLICLVKYEYLNGDLIDKEFKDYKRVDSSSDEKFYLGIINSILLSWYFKNFIATKNLQGNYSDVLPKMVRSLPLFELDLSNKTQKAQHDKMVSLVDSMLSTQKQLHEASTDSDKKLFQQKCDLLDKQIDKLVYELYGLTEGEIKIVEGK